MQAARNMVKFCPACNSSIFKSFNGRENAQCAVCGSMERHRLFVLFLLSQDLTPDTKLCVIKKGSQPSDYIKRISEYVNIDISEADRFPEFSSRNSDKYDIVYHNHVVNDGFHIKDSYKSIISDVKKIVKPGGIQVFSPGPVILIKDIYEQLFDDCLNEEIYMKNTKMDYGIIYRYTPVFAYGEKIINTCILRVSYGAPIGGNDLIVAKKAQA